MERRIVYAQLLNFKEAIVEIQNLKDLNAKQEAQAELDKAIWESALALAQSKLEQMRGERDLARMQCDQALEKAEYYKAAYEAAIKRPGGIGCFFKKFFTLWLARCH